MVVVTESVREVVKEFVPEELVIQLDVMLLVVWLIIPALHGLMALSLDRKPSSMPTKPP